MRRFLFGSAALMSVAVSESARPADLPVLAPAKAPIASPAYDWSGFYVGGHVGYATGTSEWSSTQPGGAPNLNGSLDFFHTFDAFSQAGGHFGGLQAGYNYVLPSRLMIGVEADASFPSFFDANQSFSSPVSGAANYDDTVMMFGHPARPHRL